MSTVDRSSFLCFPPQNLCPIHSSPMPHANAGTKDTTCFGPIINTLSNVFPCVLPYTVSIPSFGNDWGFVMACKSPATTTEDWTAAAPAGIDELIERYIEGGEKSLRMYDGMTHRRMFALTKALRKQLANDTRVMTKDNPVFMY